MGKAGTRDGDAPHRTARLSVGDTKVVHGGWDAMVRPTVGAPMGADRLVPRRPIPVQAQVQPPASPRVAFQRLVEKLSSRPRQARRQATPPAAGPRESTAPGAGGARPTARRLGVRPPLGEMLPQVGSFRSNEVLAINLSPEGLGKVRSGSYEVVERIELPDFGLTLTRLRLPQDLNAINGRDRLFDLLPEAGFALNRVYAQYRPSMGRQVSATGPGASVAAQGGKSCPAERCFGSVLINWQPRLAACARDVKVGVIDTGFDQAHPAFAGLRYQYKEFLPDGTGRASDQHGTGVLSLLAGNLNTGTPGLIPDASYAVANAFFADADGQPMSDTTQMLQALHWLKRSGVSVVNLSFAGPDDELMHHAVRELTKAGIVVVAAAGNEGPAAPPSYPAAYEEVIAVTAVDRNLAAYRYANRGAHIDIAAPGVDVWTAIPGRREGPQTGTSFAVPFVTAVVAVALHGVEPPPADDPVAAKRRALAQLEGHIRALGSFGRDSVFGAGLVQAPATCGPAPTLAVASSAVPSAQGWAGTVHRAAEPTSAGPLVVGTWVSTVHPAARDGVAR